MDNDDFSDHSAFFAGGDETIDSIAPRCALVRKAVAFGCAESLKMVNEDASHVIHLDVNLACQMLKVERHLPIVGVGHYREISQTW